MRIRVRLFTLLFLFSALVSCQRHATSPQPNSNPNRALPQTPTIPGALPSTVPIPSGVPIPPTADSFGKS